jgi:hypothetical protein
MPKLKQPKPDISKIDPAELERMKAMVAKVQEEGKEYAKKALKERQKREAAEYEMQQAQRKKQQEAEKNGFGGTLQVSKPEGTAPFLFLDDTRTPLDITWCMLPDGAIWRVVTSSTDFIEYIEKNGLPKYVSFDFDLGPKSPLNGAECAKWLKAHCKANKLKLPDWGGHSPTITGRQAIEDMLL